MKSIITTILSERGTGIDYSQVNLSQLFQRTPLAPRKIIVTRKGEHTPLFVLRIGEGVKEETEKIQYLKELDAKLKAHLPWTSYYESSVPLQAQEWVDGKRLLYLDKDLHVQAAHVLGHLHQKTMKVDKDLFASSLQRVQHISKKNPIPDQVISKALEVLPPIVAFSHGDYTPTNLIVHQGNILLIDWEDATYESPHLFDIIHFVTFKRLLAKRSFLTSTEECMKFLKTLKEEFARDSFVAAYSINGVTEGLESISYFLPFYFATRLEKYLSSSKKGEWKKRYITLYEDLLSASLHI